MGQARKPNYHIHRLSRALVRLRRATGLTQVQVAADLEFSFQKLSRVENEQLPGFHELRALLELYGVPTDDWETYLNMWRRANAKYWWHKLGLRDCTYFSMEHEACLIRDYQNTRLPALLQTENYAQTLLSTSASPPSADRLDNELTALAFRQHRLNDDPPLSLHCLIYQPILHTTGMNQQQLEYLRFLSEHENITIQVIPGQAPQLGALQGSFTLLSFPDKDEPDLTQVEHPIGPTLTQDLEQVAFLGRTFATLTKYAMSPVDSRDYVNKLIADV